ncbi:biopolymer transporter ExbD [Candidatus Dependentiae bacterium]|nr:biopolymer transporter ExbD [Candidatus Dependentiae bacterium]
MMRQGRLGRSRLPHSPEISLTPLIDTALVLLVIFMVATPMMHNAVKVSLPKGHVQESPGATKEDVTVYIDKDEHVFINGTLTNPQQFVQALEQKLGGTQQRVFVNADETISYGALMKVVDAIKYLAGVEDVVLATEKA